MPWATPGPPRAFRIAAEVQRLLGVDPDWVTLRGDLLLIDFERAQSIADRWRAHAPEAEPPLRASEVYGAALLEEVFHLAIAHHLREVDPGAMEAARGRVQAALGGEYEATLCAFIERYPPPDVARGAPAIEALQRSVDGVSGELVAIEEAWMCYLAHLNPALRALRPLIDLEPLQRRSRFDALIEALVSPTAAPGASFAPGQSLFQALLEPLQRYPQSLSDQLRFVQARWAPQLGRPFADLLERLHEVLVVAREEDAYLAPLATSLGRPDPMGTVASLRRAVAGEPLGERFTPDGAWMPQVVMVAKSTYVWLDQLSRAAGRPIERLDEIPETALAELAEQGFNALWLIGLWRRSRASREIKVRRGQGDALASAYALDDYAIAEELGGEQAFFVLRERAERWGIRLATDMVPNHVGIDGRWVIEHPERFISLPSPPFPGYRFDGPNLSHDPRVELRIEDGYYDGSDAAVVFERLDRVSGERRYLYHGNDGTLMPWNDTAQLDFARADVREAVIQTILEVARRAPIIRFDAAMTLAKRHIRRLWYPPPGEGGGVPSRGRSGAMTEEEFEACIPQEFWREVVDRVAAEAPDTLLLAEAFWMLEGFFVRTLGMHRVYNSAFMHMLRDQHNAEYRALMREVLAFDARILQRYVNFMNNPDEESAREQFGDGDRFFAVSTLLATLPGLPMFGHGQVEGLREKYGMEFARARLAEQPDAGAVERHRRQLAPLLRRRWQFAAVEGFRLFDAHDGQGEALEDVFAYSNAVGGARSLVLVNHRYERSQGVLRRSVPMTLSHGGPALVEGVAEALGLEGGPERFLVARDAVSGRTWVRPSSVVVEQGWGFELDGYQSLVLLDLEERVDHDGSLAALHAAGAGEGMDDAEGHLRERREPLAAPEVDRVRDAVEPLLGELLLEGAAATAPEAAGTDPRSRALQALLVLRQAPPTALVEGEPWALEPELVGPLGVHALAGVRYAEGPAVDALFELLADGEAARWRSAAREVNYAWSEVASLLRRVLTAESASATAKGVDAASSEVGQSEG